MPVAPPFSTETTGGVVRLADRRVVAGVAAGVADRLGIDPVYVRAAFVVASMVWGIGVLVYVGLWVGAPEGVPAARPRTSDRTAHVGLGLAFLGGLLLVRSVGLWPGDAVLWPAAAITFGVAAIWDQRKIDSQQALSRLFDADSGHPQGRLAVGVLLILVGLALFGSVAVPEVGNVIVAATLTGLGLVVVFGPWMWRLARELGDERRERIRQEERAEMAAHLHDSVLQTLALIQRTDDPRRMVTLARGQERELRRWLQEQTRPAPERRLTDALQELADRTESDFDVRVDVVTVGDAELDERLAAMVAAAGEALTNAARHSGTDRISLYAEATGEGVEVWVSDQGTGFDPSGVPADRQGIARSIRGRMARHGGVARIDSVPGEGTEVHLVMPKEAS